MGQRCCLSAFDLQLTAKTRVFPRPTVNDVRHILAPLLSHQLVPMSQLSVLIVEDEAILAAHLASKVKLLGYHWPYPGIGYAEHAATGYRYAPIG